MASNYLNRPLFNHAVYAPATRQPRMLRFFRNRELNFPVRAGFPLAVAVEVERMVFDLKFKDIGHHFLNAL
jgi:hypothetical protein